MTKSFGQALDPHEALAVAHHHPPGNLGCKGLGFTFWGLGFRV